MEGSIRALFADGYRCLAGDGTLFVGAHTVPAAFSAPEGESASWISWPALAQGRDTATPRTQLGKGNGGRWDKRVAPNSRDEAQSQQLA